MNLKFTKMHGCGNDYIYFNCFEQPVKDPEALSECISDRHFGVGGDGIVLICPSETADAKMRMFNIDGSEGKMCGNAIRCVGKYLYDFGLCRKNPLTVETLSGIKTLRLQLGSDGLVESVRVDMGKAVLAPRDIPVALDGETAVARKVTVGGEAYTVTCVSMGNPHCVVFIDRSVADFPIERVGSTFEFDPLFPERVNTEFVRVLDEHTLEMRVWERGSGETMACGTGACASVVAACLNGYCPKGEEITVKLSGGELRICYTDERVTMTGSATIAFIGELPEDISRRHSL